MNANDLKTDVFFTTNGKDIWELEYFCLQPTCLLRNIKTDEKMDFAMGGLTAERFHKIDMPEIKE